MQETTLKLTMVHFCQYQMFDPRDISIVWDKESETLKITAREGSRISLPVETFNYILDEIDKSGYDQARVHGIFRAIDSILNPPSEEPQSVEAILAQLKDIVAAYKPAIHHTKERR